MTQSNSSPFFSVVLAVYNGSAYVGETIESVITQTDGDWEFIIIDDCSTDETPQILADYAKKDKRIHVYRNEHNQSAAKSVNFGIRRCRGRWITRIDADDTYVPDYLARLRPVAEKARDNEFVTTWVSVMDEKGSKILDIEQPDAAFLQRMIKIENFLYSTATSFPKSLWEKVGGYPYEDKTISEDVALWIKFIDAGAKLLIIPDFLSNYRIHFNNITSINDAKIFNRSKSKNEWKKFRQNKEWRISLFLKQLMLERARSEILTLGRAQRFSLKNLQYFLLTFFPKSFVRFFMWEFRPRARAFVKNIQGRSIRV